jgi:hypothetical protein
MLTASPQTLAMLPQLLDAIAMALTRTGVGMVSKAMSGTAGESEAAMGNQSDFVNNLVIGGSAIAAFISELRPNVDSRWRKSRPQLASDARDEQREHASR